MIKRLPIPPLHTICLFPYKTTCLSLYTNVIVLFYFQEPFQITDYCLSRLLVLSLWKKFFCNVLLTGIKFITKHGKWIMQDLNLRPPVYETDALTYWANDPNGISAVSIYTKIIPYFCLFVNNFPYIFITNILFFLISI